jgi:NAD(P)-dependent dehydrogenase (short-subunit alcohol dehydrogenase family)
MSVTEKFLPLLAKSQKTKKVVLVSSGAGSMTNWATPGSETRKFTAPAYAVSKSALNALCLQFAVEYEDDPAEAYGDGKRPHLLRVFYHLYYQRARNLSKAP